jgi:hypothetical protein
MTERRNGPNVENYMNFYICPIFLVNSVQNFLATSYYDITIRQWWAKLQLLRYKVT